ncbi:MULTISPECIES: hypothetical protein, partial [unclassified Sulfurospirillum]|uniref:hypothetical protein n=1 Tax=unclassified Sulfurospirillum TaxID=2618290 RepID=UPI000503A1B2
MYKIIQFFSLASQKIAIISLVLWFMSLWSVALVSYEGDTIVGFPIVMLGFLGGNFAWFVNPLLLFLFYKPKLLVKQ